MLRSTLPLIAAELRPAVEKALAAGAELVAASAKARVPVNTGRLRNAIHVKADPEGEFIVAGNNKAFYGHIVEHGSVNAAPHPFLVPALEENRAAIEILAADAIRAATGNAL